MSHVSNILEIESTPDYALLDSGEGEKLERFGTTVLSRPDPQAVWGKRLPVTDWKKADGSFSREESGGKWALKSQVLSKWEIAFAGLKFWIKPTAFKHTGLFPEQEVNWKWLREKIKNSKSEFPNGDVEVLNLFGYTGGATLACAQAGAKVVHIDSSKAAVTWARENAESSGLKDAPIRWIIEDARLFVEREIKRGRKYQGIIMDPPAFGHGPTSELWRIEEHFLPLVESCKKLLADKPLFFLINGYSAGYSAVAYENMLLDVKVSCGGDIEIGELAIGEESRSVEKGGEKVKLPTRLLPAGIFARWSSY
jgi:23S rRNA (cytosine1962-C5)-methyltransferase